MMRVARISLAFGLLTAAPAALIAESYCVACFSPDAVYRCVIAGAPESAPADPRHQIQCVKQIAKAGGHARCSVERFSTVGCNGPERIIDPAAAVPMTPPPAGIPPRAAKERQGGAGPAPLPDHPAPNATTAGPAPTEPAATEPATPDPPPADAPPRTVEELAKTTVESTKKGLDGVTGAVKEQTEKAGDQMKGAGSAIGEAARKSWNCLTSFFSNC